MQLEKDQWDVELWEWFKDCPPDCLVGWKCVWERASEWEFNKCHDKFFEKCSPDCDLFISDFFKKKPWKTLIAVSGLKTFEYGRSPSLSCHIQSTRRKSKSLWLLRKLSTCTVNSFRVSNFHPTMQPLSFKLLENYQKNGMRNFKLQRINTRW